MTRLLPGIHLRRLCAATIRTTPAPVTYPVDLKCRAPTPSALRAHRHNYNCCLTVAGQRLLWCHERRHCPIRGQVVLWTHARYQNKLKGPQSSRTAVTAGQTLPHRHIWSKDGTEFHEQMAAFSFEMFLSQGRGAVIPGCRLNTDRID